MKIIIFADRSYNYVKPISTGLHKTLLEMGYKSEIWYDGIYWLMKLNLFKVFLADVYRVFLNLKSRKKDLYIYRFWHLLTFYNARKKKALEECDCIVVVQNCPSCFDDNNLKRLDWLRDTFKKPVVNYDFHYLPNQGWWGRIRQFERFKGLEQFDWYLPIGITTEFAIPKEIPCIFNCIGMDIKSDDLFPEQDEFVVLLDFPREEHDTERCRIKNIMDELSIKWVELNGRYTTEQIRSIYRKASIYVVSTRESFGLPIIETQLCGAKILVPYKEWVPAHFLNKSPYDNGVGDLGNNYLIYNGDRDTLTSILKFEKENICYKDNVVQFQKDYPYYYSINKQELMSFVDKIKNKTIKYTSHNSYVNYNQYMNVNDDYNSANVQKK